MCTDAHKHQIFRSNKMEFITKWVHLAGTYIVHINAQEKKKKWGEGQQRKEEKFKQTFLIDSVM